MISPCKNWLSLTIAGWFVIGVFSASAETGHFLPEMVNDQSWKESHFERAQGAMILRNQFTAGNDFASDSEFPIGIEETDDFALAAESANSFTRIDLTLHQNVTVSGSPGETVTLNLRDFVLARNSMFTLEGTATTTFIINVRNQFALSGRSRVVLAGDVHCENVVFNILGKGDVVRLTKRASLAGVLVANRRTVRLGGHSIINGQVFAKRVRLRGASQIIPPPIVSP